MRTTETEEEKKDLEKNESTNLKSEPTILKTNSFKIFKAFCSVALYMGAFYLKDANRKDKNLISKILLMPQLLV